MNHINIGAINGNVIGSAVGDYSTVYNAGPVTSADDYVQRIDALRAKLKKEADSAGPDVAVDDAIAALTWLQDHYADQEKPADAEQRLGALKRLRAVWHALVEIAKQVPANLVAGWIIEAMK